MILYYHIVHLYLHLYYTIEARLPAPPQRLSAESGPGPQAAYDSIATCDTAKARSSIVLPRHGCLVEHVPDHRHRHLKAFEEHMQKHVSSCFVTE